MLYLVIIGDIIKSRKLSNRYEVQKTFASVVSEVQTTYAGELVSPITLTIGDEFQSVMRQARELFKIVDDLETQMLPVQLRHGFGIGEIDTEINEQYSIGMDGPAFHRAREALEISRKQNLRYYLCYDNSRTEQQINLLLSWIDAASRNWTPEKRKTLAYKELGYTQVQIAKLVGISQPAVSQHMKSPHFNLTRKTRIFIEDEIHAILRGR